MTRRAQERMLQDNISPMLSRSDGLLQIDASWTLAQAARYCRAQNWIFPIARPLPAMTLIEACVRLPIFADAFVAEVTGVAMSEPVRTPRAPRAAMGPDLLGGMMTDIPLFEATSLHVRVFDRARTRVRRAYFPSAQAAAEQVLVEMLEGRAFALDAYAEQDAIHMHVLEAAREGLQGAEISFRSSLSVRVKQGHSLLPGDTAGISRSLQKQERVVGAPFMGRIGRLCQPSQATFGASHQDLDAACRALADRMVQGSNDEENHRGE